MNDVNWSPRHLRQGDGTRCRFRLGRRRSRQGVIFGGSFALGQCALHDNVDRPAVFRVHTNHSAEVRGSRHSAKDRRIVEHEHARVRHEQLESGHAFMDERLHFLQLRVRQIRDDAMKRVVNHSLAIGLFHPGIECLMKSLAFVLNCEVDQRCRTTMRRRYRPRFEVVRALRSTERHIQMCMHIDTARHHITICGVDDVTRIFRRQVFGNCDDSAANYAHVARVGICRREHRPVANHRIEAHVSWPPRISCRAFSLHRFQTRFASYRDMDVSTHHRGALLTSPYPESEGTWRHPGAIALE